MDAYRVKSSAFDVEAVVVGPLQVNCWIVQSAGSDEAVVIDPGSEPERILERIEDRGAMVRWILLTHAHVDHIAGVGTLHRATGAPVWLHSEDRELYRSPDNALPPFLDHPTDLPDPVASETPALSAGSMRVIETPGHTPGGCTFVFEGDPLMLVCGDVLFQGSVGRTDLPGGDAATLKKSLRRLLEFPDDAVICPGHGPVTRIGEERRFNPFLAQWGV